MDNGGSEAAIVYNLPPMAVGSDVNRVYASDLARLVRKLEFPSSYAHEIEVSA